MEFKFCGIKLFDYYEEDEVYLSGCADYHKVNWVNDSMSKYNNPDEENNYIFRIWLDGDVEVYNNETLIETRLMWDLVNEVLEG